MAAKARTAARGRRVAARATIAALPSGDGERREHLFQRGEVHLGQELGPVLPACRPPDLALARLLRPPLGLGRGLRRRRRRPPRRRSAGRRRRRQRGRRRAPGGAALFGAGGAAAASSSDSSRTAAGLAFFFFFFAAAGGALRRGLLRLRRGLLRRFPRCSGFGSGVVRPTPRGVARRGVPASRLANGSFAPDSRWSPSVRATRSLARSSLSLIACAARASTTTGSSSAKPSMAATSAADCVMAAAAALPPTVCPALRLTSARVQRSVSELPGLATRRFCCGNEQVAVLAQP